MGNKNTNNATIEHYDDENVNLHNVAVEEYNTAQKVWEKS